MAGPGRAPRGTSHNTTLTTALAMAAVLGSLLLVGCGDPQEGAVFGTFEFDASVSEMNLAGIGVDLGDDALPETERDYELKPAETTILWIASGTTYSLAVTIEADPGVAAEDPSLLPLSFGTPSEDGEDRLLFFQFVQDEVTISERIAYYTGVEVP
jgi:hypothetical protein